MSASVRDLEQECAAGYLRVLRDVVATHGVPGASTWARNDVPSDGAGRTGR
jgi:hypothetical protein